MHRPLLLALVLIGAAASAAPYQPPVEAAPKARPNAWIVRKKGEGLWCAFASLKTVQAALDSGDYEAENRTVVWLDHGQLTAIMVSNDSDDAIADDVYHFDTHQKIARMVRTGHYIWDPMFSVTFAPDWTGRLEMTPASREVVRLMEQAEYEPYITDWPKFASFDRMPFRGLIQLKPVAAVKTGCAPAAP